MRLSEHIDLVLAGDLTPRIVERVNRSGHLYYAWTRLKEGPARPDYAAAMADLRDFTYSDRP